MMKIIPQGVAARIQIITTTPNQAKARVNGSKVKLFDRRPVGPPLQNLAFSGRGFIPDLISDHGYSTFPEACRTSLENEGVHGREGMLPPAGALPPTQLGQKPDEGAAGAGSFAEYQGWASKG